PRIERMALRADVGVDHAALSRATRHEGVPTRAGHRRLHVVGGDAGLHGVSLKSWSPGRRGMIARGVNRNLALVCQSSARAPNREPHVTKALVSAQLFLGAGEAVVR